MEAVKEINAKIMELTMQMHTEYPELVKYLNEMPATIPNTGKPKMNEVTLTEYYQSLQSLIKEYKLSHPLDNVGYM